MSDGGKNAKYGRNKKDATRYSMEKRLEKNKARKMKRHLKRMGLPANYVKCFLKQAGGPPHPRPGGY